MEFLDKRFYLISAVLLSLIFSVASVSCAANVAEVTSDMTGPLILAGELSLYCKGSAGKDQAQDGLKALFATGLVTGALKLAVNEKRPESDDTDSFPSAHTSGAFAMATVLADYDPSSTWLVYGIAAAVGWSRVEQDKHYWRDVIVGALIGHFVASSFADGHGAVAPRGIGFQTEW